MKSQMAEEMILDEDGFGVQFLRTDKNRLTSPAFNANTLNNMTSIKLRDDDILLCSYPKSGCHWLWENIRCLRDGQIHTDTVEKETAMMEMKDISEINQLDSPRILNNHSHFDDQPTDLLKGKTKLILLYRNPKDVAVSFYFHMSRSGSHKYQGQFPHFLKRYAKGNVFSDSIFDYLNQWEAGLQQNPQIPHIAVSYDELQKNPISERDRIASFLGKSYDDNFLMEVAKATSIDKMRETKGATTRKDIAGKPVWYRKGVTGDWKNYFTVAENEWFDDKINSQMSESKLFHFIYC